MKASLATKENSDFIVKVPPQYLLILVPVKKTLDPISPGKFHKKP
jgi:hypothetical protein